MGGEANRLSLGLGLVHPLASYRVYDVEYSQLVRAWCFLEVKVELLDKDRLGLSKYVVSLSPHRGSTASFSAALLT